MMKNLHIFLKILGIFVDYMYQLTQAAKEHIFVNF